MGRILFIAPHPDDEIFGCGGTIIKHRENGDEIFWLVVSSGYTSEGFSLESIKTMRDQASHVNSYLKFSLFKRLNFPSTKLDSLPISEIISSINQFINDCKPDTIYVNYRGDAHTDHKVVFDSVWSCCKSFRNPFIKNVYVYEVISETNHSNPFSVVKFSPNTYQDISPFIEGKKTAALLYGSELGKHPYPRSLFSIEALAKLRGSEVNLEYAEAFICIKRVL